VVEASLPGVVETFFLSQGQAAVGHRRRRAVAIAWRPARGKAMADRPRPGAP